MTPGTRPTWTGGRSIKPRGADVAEDQAAAVLAAIRERSRWKSSAAGLVGPGATAVGSAEDVPRLLRAVEAALNLHQVSDDSGCEPHCVACTAAVRWAVLVPPDRCLTREAITAALTGEDAPGA